MKTDRTSLIPAVLVISGVLAWIIFGLWLDARHAHKTAEWFVNTSESRGAEAKILGSTKYFDNPFTWFNPSPNHVVARHSLADGYMVYSLKIQDSGESHYHEFFVIANCESRTFRLVDQIIHEESLKNYGHYSVLGNKLHPWGQGGEYDLINVILRQEPQQGRRNNLAFISACKWDEL